MTQDDVAGVVTDYFATPENFEPVGPPRRRRARRRSHVEWTPPLPEPVETVAARGFIDWTWR